MQVSLAKRYCIRLELYNEYAHLCALSQPFTSLFFGADVSKVAKYKEDG
jgi:hypothetical protein